MQRGVETVALAGRGRDRTADGVLRSAGHRSYIFDVMKYNAFGKSLCG
jgi:hypothetical protein